MVAPYDSNDVELGQPETPPDDQQPEYLKASPNGPICNSEDHAFYQDVYDDSSSEASSSILEDAAQVCRSGGNLVTLKDCEGPIHIGNNHTSTNIIIADRKALPQVLAAADDFKALGFKINEVPGLDGSLNVSGELTADKKLQQYGKLMAVVISLILVLVVGVASLQIFQLKRSNAGIVSGVPDDNYDGVDIPHGNVSLVTRRECNLARPSKIVMEDLRAIPPEYAIISHTGGDGRAYEGRQWNKTGAHTFKYNCASVGISFIGNFVDEAPRNRQVEAATLLLDQLVQNGMLQSNYSVYYHMQLISTESPGQHIIKIVKSWPHWSSQLPSRCS
ncbi:Peptidoglycan recognition protein [Nesidiocoris tenuis]|uniref:Peptidoglycan recognition protein n=1 Tax=Nesidiocoris tenuis TaxID=355587 RepID=A0ABN7B2C3_9HEMI|nr:Peptidoglycan recognition protein [Nesidiocoris tenuis]